MQRRSHTDLTGDISTVRCLAGPWEDPVLAGASGEASWQCVIGNGRPYNVALIVTEPTLAARYPTGEALQAAVRAGVDRANARLSRVKRFAVLTSEWLPDSDELTPTMKLKRRPIEQKYAAQIDALYTTKENR